MEPPYTPHEDRFWSKVNKTDDCWLWTGNVNKGREYGRFKLNGKMELAHRVSYALANGPIPAGVTIDHRCHVHPCVRPEHLRATTQRENSQNHNGAQANSKSGVRGVWWYKAGQQWAASVQDAGKRVHVGYFDTVEDAERAVVAKRNELHTHNDRDR